MAIEKGKDQAALDLDSRIERYLNGEMSQAMRSDFEKELAANPEAAELLAAERMVRSSSAHVSERLKSVGLAAPAASLVSALGSKNRFAVTLWYGIAALTVFLGFFLIRGVMYAPDHGKPAIPQAQSPAPLDPQPPVAAPVSSTADSSSGDGSQKKAAVHAPRAVERSSNPKWHPDATPGTPPVFVDSSIHTR